jgi:hypothetical protein
VGEYTRSISAEAGFKNGAVLPLQGECCAKEGSAADIRGQVHEPCSARLRGAGDGDAVMAHGVASTKRPACPGPTAVANAPKVKPAAVSEAFAPGAAPGESVPGRLGGGEQTGSSVGTVAGGATSNMPAIMAGTSGTEPGEEVAATVAKAKEQEAAEEQADDEVIARLGAAADDKDVMAAQQEWLTHSLLREPEIIVYSVEHDPNVAWAKRMAVLRCVL